MPPASSEGKSIPKRVENRVPAICSLLLTFQIPFLAIILSFSQASKARWGSFLMKRPKAQVLSVSRFPRLRRLVPRAGLRSRSSRCYPNECSSGRLNSGCARPCHESRHRGGHPNRPAISPQGCLCRSLEPEQGSGDLPESHVSRQSCSRNGGECWSGTPARCGKLRFPCPWGGGPSPWVFRVEF